MTRRCGIANASFLSALVFFFSIVSLPAAAAALSCSCASPKIRVESATDGRTTRTRSRSLGCLRTDREYYHRCSALPRHIQRGGNKSELRIVAPHRSCCPIRPGGLRDFFRNTVSGSRNGAKDLPSDGRRIVRRRASVLSRIGAILAGVLTPFARNLPAAAAAASSAVVVPNAPTKYAVVSRQVQISVEAAFRIVFASLLGSALGFGRSATSKSSGPNTGAGMRTMSLVSLGACVFCLCGTHGFAVRSATEGIPGLAEFASVDTSRMASSIATGVGFIGAGVITNTRMPDGTYDRESAVRGLTTAATIWMSAAVGAAAGAGMYYAAGQFVLLCVTVLKVGEWMGGQEQESDASGGGKRTEKKPKKTTKPPIAEYRAGEDVAGAANRTAAVQLRNETMGSNVEIGVRGIDEGGNITEASHAASSQPEQDGGDDVNVTITDGKKEKSVDPLVEKFLRRGGTFAAKSSQDESIVEKADDDNDRDDDLDDNSDSQIVIW